MSRSRTSPTNRRFKISSGAARARQTRRRSFRSAEKITPPAAPAKPERLPVAPESQSGCSQTLVCFDRRSFRTGLIICAFSAPSVKDAIWHYRSCRPPRHWPSNPVRSQSLAKAFGIVLRKHRKAKKFSQELLAEKADVAAKMVSLIERFERNLSVNLADSLAQGLGVPLWQLIREAEEVRRKHTPKRS